MRYQLTDAHHIALRTRSAVNPTPPAMPSIRCTWFYLAEAQDNDTGDRGEEDVEQHWGQRTTVLQSPCDQEPVRKPPVIHAHLAPYSVVELADDSD